MSDLGDILDAIKLEAPTATRGAEPFRREETHRVWTVEDKTVERALGLTQYEIYWLIWRIEVHLKSYEAMEWSEMKEVLRKCKAKLETLWYQSTKEHWYVDSTSTLVEERSGPAGIAAVEEKPSSPPLSVSGADIT